MGDYSHYFLTKISAINYNMAIHKGDALSRLNSQAEKIILLEKEEVPIKFIEEFNKLITDIHKSMEKFPNSPSSSIGISGIYNQKATMYIKLLIEIENELTI